MISFTFLVATFIVVIIPGTGVIYTLSTGLSRGKTMSVYAVIGCTLGSVPHIIMGILSLVLFQKLNETAVNIVRILGALYLFYMGIQLFRHNSIEFGENNNEGPSPFITLLKGITLNLLNPKPTLFFIAFLPQFIRPEKYPILLHSMILGLVFMLVTFIIFLIYGLLAGSFSDLLKKSPKALLGTQRIFGSIFILLALQLMVSRL